MSASTMVRGTVVASLLLAAPPALAELKMSQDLQFHGFAAQGFVLSNGNNVNGSSDDSSGSLRYQELGVNASWRPHATLLLSGQLASVRNGRATDQPLVLEYGLVDYTPWQGERGRVGLRAGKLKLPIGFYNDSRDAVFTRPSIILPQGVYLDTSGGREFGYFSSWGASLYGDVYAGNHALYAEMQGYGEQELGENADIAILRTQALGEFRVKQGFILRFSDDYDGGRVRAAVSLATVDLDYEAADQPPSPSNPFALDGKLDFKQAVASLQYNWPSFTLTAEYVWRTFKLDDLIAGPLSSAVDLNPSGAYIQGTWRMTPAWSAFVRYDEQIRDGADRDGTRQEAESQRQSAATGGAVPVQPRHYYFAHDWSIGTRYDLLSNVSVLGEFHYVDGVAWVNPLDNPGFGTGQAKRHWNFLTLMLAYRF